MGREEQWEGWMPTLFNCGLTAEWKGRKHPFLRNQWTEDNPQVTTFMEASQENKRYQRNGRPSQQLKGDQAQASIRQTGRLRPRVGPGLTWGPTCIKGYPVPGGPFTVVGGPLCSSCCTPQPSKPSGLAPVPRVPA